MYLSRPFVDYYARQAWAARRRLDLGVSPAEYLAPTAWLLERRHLVVLRTPGDIGHDRDPTLAFVQKLREAVDESSLGVKEKNALLNRCLPQEGAKMFTADQVLLLSLVLKRPTYLDWVDRNVENGNELDRRVISMLYDLVHNMLNDPPFDTSHLTAPRGGRWR